jgi:hypothetical protein
MLLRFVHASLAGRLADLLRLPVDVAIGEVLGVRGRTASRRCCGAPLPPAPAGVLDRLLQFLQPLSSLAVSLVQFADRLVSASRAAWRASSSARAVRSV